MRTRINYINKTDFLLLYQGARLYTFTLDNICNSFTATDLVLHNPDRVLEQLHVQLRTPSPLPTQPPIASQQPWVPETPYNIAELQLQSDSLNALIRYYSRSPLSPTRTAVKQLVKGCQLVIYFTTILFAENRNLRAANKKVKRKKD